MNFWLTRGAEPVRMWQAALSRIDDEAKGVDELQNRITSVVEEARLRCLQQNGTVEEAIRLARCCWEGASLHNVVMPLEDRLSLRDWEYRSATRHQYGMVPIIA